MGVVKVDPVFHPQKIINDTLFFNYQNKVLNSTLTIAKASSKFFEINYGELCDKLNFFQKNRAPSNFFSYNSYLVYILKKSKNVNDLKDTLGRVDLLFTDSYFTDDCKVKNLNEVPWLDFLCEDILNISQKSFVENSEFYSFNAKINHVDYSCFEEHKKYILEALEILKKSNLEYYTEFNNYISEVVLFDGEGITGWSSPRHLGAIFIRVYKGNYNLENIILKDELKLNELNPVLYYLEQIIHEVAHTHLDLIIDEYDPIILNDDNSSYVSPIRHDKRPMKGVFHACFVLVRILYIFSNLSIDDMELRNFAFLRSNKLRKMIDVGIREIKANAKLTPFGKDLFYQMKKSIN
jgi:hypothetical protein